MKRKLFVTGGAGFIGSNFVHYWTSKYPDDSLLVIDALTYAGNIKNIQFLIDQKKINFQRINICDKIKINEIMFEFCPTHLINFAAETHVDNSINNPNSFLETNIIGTFNLLESFRLYWLENNQNNNLRFMQISTDEVYGSLGLNKEKFSESYPFQPKSPYSASKASADHLVDAWHNTYGIPILRSNCSNNYGPYQYPEKLIPLAITNIIQGKAIPIYGDGLNIRDWLHVEDHCAAIDKILLNGEIGENYCIGGNNQITNIDLIKYICILTDKICFQKDIVKPIQFSENLIEYVTDRKGHDFRYSISNKKIMDKLNWQPKISIEEGIKSTINWFLGNRKWWDNKI